MGIRRVMGFSRNWGAIDSLPTALNSAPGGPARLGQPMTFGVSEVYVRLFWKQQ
jgi:hypothetical protein